jgi:hypothetical protein
MLKKIPIEKLILVLAAGFAAYNFGLAGGFIEFGQGGHFSLGGLAAGIVVNVSLAIAASRYGSLKGHARTRQATLAFIGMLILAPALVAPVVFYSLPGDFLMVWWLRALWAIGWPLVADLAIVLAGAVSGKGLITLAEPAAQPAAGADDSALSASGVRAHKKRSADAVRTECAALAAQYACTEPQCGWTPSVDALITAQSAGKSARSAAASAKAAHTKNRHPKPIAIDKSLLMATTPKKGGDAG